MDAYRLVRVMTLVFGEFVDCFGLVTDDARQFHGLTANAVSTAGSCFPRLDAFECYCVPDTIELGVGKGVLAAIPVASYAFDPSRSQCGYEDAIKSSHLSGIRALLILVK